MRIYIGRKQTGSKKDLGLLEVIINKAVRLLGFTLI